MESVFRIGTLNCPWNQSALVKRETCLARWYDEINYWATYCFLSENLNVVGVVTLLASKQANPVH